MTISPASVDRGERFVELCLVVLRRAAGLALFALGVAYWVRLVGVFPGRDWRFDLMSPPWRAAVSILAVLCPVAGVGVWLAASWGVVLWLMLVALELAMHFALPQVFGGPTFELAALVGALGALLLLRLCLFELRRRANLRKAGGE